MNPDQHILSVIIPIFNEERTVFALLKKVMEVQLVEGFSLELILVDDCSSDESSLRIQEFIDAHPEVQEVRHITHTHNQGKGAAVRTGLQHVTGNYVLIQDADLELDPQDFNLLLGPILQGRADIVYGSRFLNAGRHTKQMRSHFMANRVITGIGNLLSGLSLTDLQTCYKLVPTDVFKSLDLREQRFAFDPEVTMRLSRVKGLRWAEVPITYHPRLTTEGKKIGYMDGFRAIYSLIKYRFF